MKHSTPPTRHIRSFAEKTDISDETVEFAVDMARIASQSGYANDWLPRGIAAGCLYAAALVVDSSGGRSRSKRNSRQSESNSDSRSRNRMPERPTNRNPQIGLHRSDHTSTEMTICERGSITPASTRRYAQKVAALYLESHTVTLEPRTRSRLTRLASR